MGQISFMQLLDFNIYFVWNKRTTNYVSHVFEVNESWSLEMNQFEYPSGYTGT